MTKQEKRIYRIIFATIGVILLLAIFYGLVLITEPITRFLNYLVWGMSY